MPSTSEKQRRFMGAALRAKRTGEGSPQAKRAAKGMNESQLRDYARKPRRSKRK